MTLPPARRYGDRTAFAAVLALAALLSGCSPSADGFAAGPAPARAAADDFLGSLAARFSDPVRAPKAMAARRKFGRHALTPSLIYNDTSVWNYVNGRDSTRALILAGQSTPRSYLITPRWPPPRPDSPADGIHGLHLKQLSASEYEWTTTSDFSIGRVAPAAFAQVIAGLFTAAEDRSSATLRAQFRTELPRTLAILERLFVVDTLRTVQDRDGGTTLTLGLRITPSRMPGAYADYLKEYLSGTRLRMVATDARGSRWMEISGRDMLFMVRLRSREGKMAPLEGGMRAMPDSLIIRSDVTTKIGIFTVGWSNLVGDFYITRGATERGWLFQFRKEPEWRLPLGARHFIPTPLRRPFQGNGATYEIRVFGQPNGQTILSRRGKAVVQESAILRFFNRLTARATGDFYGKTEVDESRFMRDVFTALQADVTARLD
ncbi:MAG TPA: hypothetical protein VMY38_06715 [Gemmatimonadaceae bacterium]|nr:hypothetical protein [Gemmatimonadaceae bacterium]